MNNNSEKMDKNTEQKVEPKADEVSGFYFSSSIKIHDPNTSEVLVQIRGDN